MSDTATQIEALHSTWEKLTGQVINRRVTERVFYEMASAGFTDDDLRCVIQGMQKFNRGGSGAQFRINLVKVCGDLESFGSVCAEFRAKERNKKPAPTPAQQIKQAFSPILVEDLTSTGTRSISEVFKAIK